MPKKFQYKSVVAKFSTPPKDHEVEAAANSLGEQGWDIFALNMAQIQEHPENDPIFIVQFWCKQEKSSLVTL